MNAPGRSRNIEVRPASSPADWSAATTLLEEYAAWIRSAAGFDLAAAQPGFADELRDLAAAYADRGDGTLLLAHRQGAAVGTVAVRVAADVTAELKRLFVRPDGRGSGAADALVGAAVDAAAALGARTMWLETKPGLMDRAVAVYERHGFRRSPAPSALPVDGVVPMHRDLVAARRAS